MYTVQGRAERDGSILEVGIIICDAEMLVKRASHYRKITNERGNGCSYHKSERRCLRRIITATRMLIAKSMSRTHDIRESAFALALY